MINQVNIYRNLVLKNLNKRVMISQKIIKFKNNKKNNRQF